MNIKIEHNVPMPEPNTRISGKWIGALRKMEVGDSFELPEESNQTLRQCAIRYIERNKEAAKKKFTIRRVGPGSYRCWRIK